MIMSVSLLEWYQEFITFKCNGCGKVETIIDCEIKLNMMATDILNGANPFKEGWQDSAGFRSFCKCD